MTDEEAYDRLTKILTGNRVPRCVALFRVDENPPGPELAVWELVCVHREEAGYQFGLLNAIEDGQRPYYWVRFGDPEGPVQILRADVNPAEDGYRLDLTAHPLPPELVKAMTLCLAAYPPADPGTTLGFEYPTITGVANHADFTPPGRPQ